MNFNLSEIQKKWLKRLLYLVAIFLLAIIMVVISYFIFENKYKGRIYSGMSLDSLDLSGATYEQARGIISKRVDEIYNNGIPFAYRDKKISLMPIISSLEDGWSYQVIFFNIDETVDRLFIEGRRDDFFENIKTKASLLYYGKNIDFAYDINEEYLREYLKNNFKEFETPSQDAELTATSTVNSEGEENIIFTIEEENYGQEIDYKNAIEKLKQNLKNLNSDQIILELKNTEPNIYKKELTNIEQKAETLVSLSPLILKAEGNTWEIGPKELARMISLDKKNGEVALDLNDELLAEYLQENIAKEFDVEPVNAKFKFEDGKVVEFQAPKNGYQLDISSSTEKIKSNLFINKATTTELIFSVAKSSVGMHDTNNLGIREIIGTGHSNFSGSPANRRHNISVGANTLYGLIIKPNEEFSLVENLGAIDASTGYLPELVIKENETIPEYGGGLCQIATTLFRAALRSGLPITERRNHSYRVSYYEPAGMDAAVYIPKPDVRFINDTGNNILIITRIVGNDLYFDFWGTRDGRKIEVGEPVIYNITYPGPTKMIETTELEVGTKKCTESAHNGADTYFDYKVTYPNEEVKEERFTSHYVAWRAVCFVGVEELSKEEGSEEEEEEEENETTGDGDNEESTEENDKEASQEDNQNKEDENIEIKSEEESTATTTQ